MSFLVRKELISILGTGQEKYVWKVNGDDYGISMLNMTLSDLINMKDLPNNGWQWPFDAFFLNENMKLRIIGPLPLPLLSALMEWYNQVTIFPRPLWTVKKGPKWTVNGGLCKVGNRKLSKNRGPGTLTLHVSMDNPFFRIFLMSPIIRVSHFELNKNPYGQKLGTVLKHFRQQFRPVHLE